MSDTQNDALTPPEVAAYLRIAKNTVYELIRRGELRAYRIGRKVRIDRQDIEAYMRQTQNKESTVHKPAPIAQAEFVVPPTAPAAKDFQAHNQNVTAGNIVLCGQDICLDILAQNLVALVPNTHVLRSYLGSYNGLHALYQGEVNVATAHLWDAQTDTYNLPFLRFLLPGTPVVAIHVCKRAIGYYVLAGNPKKIHGWNDLGRSDLVLVNRERGSGMRVLVDGKLVQAGILANSVAGYNRECSTHLSAAATVARGGGDYAVGNEKVSHKLSGIDFIPLGQETYDLIFRLEDAELPVFRALTSILSSPAFKEQLEGLGGYDTAQTGIRLV